MRMPRLLTAVSLATVVVTAAACGGGAGAGKDSGDDTREAAATPVTAAAGWVTQRGEDWSFSHPDGWKDVSSADPGTGKESSIFQSPPGVQGIPSQIGIGTASRYKDPLKTAVRIARDINETRFPTYEVRKEGPFAVAGATGYEIDATYDSFTDEPVKVRIVDIYVQTPDKRQMNFFVRGPETDLEELDVDRVVDSFRVLAGKSGTSS